MTEYSETVGEHLRRMRLGPRNMKRGASAKIAPKPMAPPLHIGVAEGPSGRIAGGVPQPERFCIPHEVLADRDRRMAMAPRSLTAQLLGDPPTPDWYKRA